MSIGTQSRKAIPLYSETFRIGQHVLKTGRDKLVVKLEVDESLAANPRFIAYIRYLDMLQDCFSYFSCRLAQWSRKV